MLFTTPFHKHVNHDVIFVADLFVDDYVGGAELTSEALITSSQLSIKKIRCRDLTMDVVEQHKDKHWVFGNFSQIPLQLLTVISKTLRYSVLEYDYKFCGYRSPDKHKSSTGFECDCHKTRHGMCIESFLKNAMSVWWMSEKQRDVYLNKFPALSMTTNTVLSSVFSKTTLETIKRLKASQVDTENVSLILGSDSWVKGQEAAVAYCQTNDEPYEIVWNMPYESLLKKMAASRRLVYLPAGADTCPRLVIEAKLLGCDLVLNDNVQHKDEEWFNKPSDEIESYLLDRPNVFWSKIKEHIKKRGTVSGYTTTYNCVKQEYPFEDTIKSMLTFCDEVCVVDGGSTDDTWEKLIELAHPDATQKLSEKERQELSEDIRAMSFFGGAGTSSHQSKLNPTKVKLRLVPRDWEHPRHAVFDGLQKAEARKMCTSEFCWQMDTDEVVSSDDAHKIKDMLLKGLPNEFPVLSLPVVEYWGGYDKVRVDVMPWKWRLSKNLSHITHGVPGHLRVFNNVDDSEPRYYALPGTDGCDMINAITLDPLPNLTFYGNDAESLRQNALSGDINSLKEYEIWLNNVVNQLPTIFHYSWFDLERKIKLYKGYWTRHWESLNGKKYLDTPESNMMFDVPWSQVTQQMIRNLANELQNIGGWIWHKKWDKTITPWIVVNRKARL